MKTVKLGLLLLLPVFIISCSTSKNKHDGELINTAAILSYKDSIDKNLPKFTAKKSLPYSVGDYTFLVSKYSGGNRAVLLVEQGRSVKYGIRQKRYYLKNKKLVLYTESAAEKPGSPYYVEKRAFYNNGVQFAANERRISEKDSVSKPVFEDTKPLLVNLKKAIRMYDQALNQTGPFDLTFNGIIEYPKANYIVLGNPRLKPYRSALLILKQDHLISELMNNPIYYRGRKLTMNWEKRNNEYVYLSGRFR